MNLINRIARVFGVKAKPAISHLYFSQAHIDKIAQIKAGLAGTTTADILAHGVVGAVPDGNGNTKVLVFTKNTSSPSKTAGTPVWSGKTSDLHYLRIATPEDIIAAGGKIPTPNDVMRARFSSLAFTPRD